MYAGEGDAVLYAVDLRCLPQARSANEVRGRGEGLQLAPCGRYSRAYLRNGTRLANLNTGEWIVTGGIPADAVIRATIQRNGQAVEVLEDAAYRGDFRAAPK